jgi:LytS/YehU family sensor histidine kinase
MNSVQWLINSDEKLSASEYLHTFSDLVRQNMQNVSDEIVSLQKELMLVENYLKLEKLRFKDFLTYKISIEESIEAEEIMIPPLLIQPLVENAIKHGLFPRQSIENYVHINIYEQYDLLRIEVHDNGVGMQHATSRETVYRPVGLDNIRKRLEQLASIHAAIISFEISEIVDAEGKIEGTLATITIDTESFSSHHRS